MSKQLIIKTTVLFSFFLSLLSTAVALASGGDIVTIIIERFFVVFAISAGMAWLTLTVINSVVIGAVQKTVDEIRKDSTQQEHGQTEPGSMAETLRKAHEEGQSKGKILDLTSPPGDIDISSFNVGLEDIEQPEIQEFEPFKPRHLEAE